MPPTPRPPIPRRSFISKGRGKEAKLSFIGHALMENRSGLVVATTVTKATGTAERKAAEEMIVRHSPGVRRITLGGDKGYDAASFVADMRALNVTPHIAQNISGRRSAIDAAPRAIPATKRASGRGSASRSRSAGARRSAASPGRCCAASRNSASSSR